VEQLTRVGPSRPRSLRQSKRWAAAMLARLALGGLVNEGDDTAKGLQALVSDVLKTASILDQGEAQISPELIAIMMQAAGAAQLVKLRMLEESRIPTGSFSIGLTVSAKSHIRLADPAISFSMINDGPNSVYLEYSTGQNEFPIRRTAPVLINETFSFNATFPVIRSIDLDVESATTAAVRIKGQTGRLLR